ncbi:MAG TPA: amidase [Hyphomicrobiales bacterium]|nr:amidase [Hyphomicrobiales bacterium]
MAAARRDVVALVAAFRDGTASPVAAVEEALGRIEACEPALNAFVVRAEQEELLAEARAAEARWAGGAPRGPLDGVPVALKDNMRTTRWPTRSGSLTSATQPSDFDAPPVCRLMEAGALIVGKTTTPEFGWKGVTDGRLTGITRNPHDTALTPGGSSGGAAAAVAAGMVAAAVGTDAAGSVRIPAAFCGLVGLKATRGRIPAFPASAIWTLGHTGPLTTSVRDCALLLDVLSGPDLRDWNALPPPGERFADAVIAPEVRGLRIAYSPTFGHAAVEPEVAGRVAAVADCLADLGAAVEEVTAPLPDARAAFRVYFETGMSHLLRRYDAAQREKLDPGLAAMARRGGAITRDAFLEAYEFQIRICREARIFHGGYDLLVTPTTAVAPFPVGRLSPEGYDADNWLDWTPFTYPFNLTGQPALTLPCGTTRDGRPVGAQIVGPVLADALVLRAAAALEASGINAAPATASR